MSMHVPEMWRVLIGKLASDESYGNNGQFKVPVASGRRPYPLLTIASDGAGWKAAGFALPAWEHVSVSTPVRCPTWEEMCFVKSIFWDAEDVVMQLHPPESRWVNNHPYCLHLWRPVGIDIPPPPDLTVGIRGARIVEA